MPVYSQRLLGSPRLQIHFSVLLWGFTAILGRLITLPAVALVWWRMAAVAAVLLAIPWVWRQLRLLSRRLIGGYSAAGGQIDTSQPDYRPPGFHRGPAGGWYFDDWSADSGAG